MPPTELYIYQDEWAIERSKRYEQDQEKHRAQLPVPENPDDL